MSCKHNWHWHRLDEPAYIWCCALCSAIFYHRSSQSNIFVNGLFNDFSVPVGIGVVVPFREKPVRKPVQ